MQINVERCLMEKNKTKIFITGAGGFIGKHLLRELTYLDVKLFLLIREEDVIPDYLYSNIEWIKGDLNNPDSYSEFIKQSDVVIHMAAELYNMEYFWKTNVEAVEQLINIINTSSVKKVIHLSSVGVVGMQNSSKKILVNENTQCSPKNEYERTKLISEKLWKEKLINRDLVIIRPTNVFGEEHPRNHLKNVIKHIATKKCFLCSRHSMVNYVYVGDIAAYILFFLKNTEIKGTYNIGGSISLVHFVNIIRKHTTSDCKIVYIPGLFFYLIKTFKLLFPLYLFQKLISLNNRVVYSDEKLKKLCQYQYGIETGLKKICDYYLKHRKDA